MEETQQEQEQVQEPKPKRLHKIPTEIITIIGNWCVIIAVIISYVPMHGWLLSKYFWPIWLIGVALSGIQLTMTKNKISGAVGVAVAVFALVKYL
ncbi:MAG: hypothetical protein II852_04640 [Bacteroidales bacterium]|nr:hypothetical protein [Bacteroidales bacterium]